MSSKFGRDVALQKVSYGGSTNILLGYHANEFSILGLN